MLNLESKISFAIRAILRILVANMRGMADLNKQI